jgi:hypothetical protein
MHINVLEIPLPYCHEGMNVTTSTEGKNENKNKVMINFYVPLCQQRFPSTLLYGSMT